MSYNTEYSKYVNAMPYLRDAPTTVEGHREQAIGLLRLADQYNTETTACIAAAEVHVRLAELIVAERAAAAAGQTAAALTRLAEQNTDARRWFRWRPMGIDTTH